MGLSVEVHGRTRAGHIKPVYTALLVLTALLLIAATGCGSKGAEQKSAGTKAADDSKPTASAETKRGSKRSQTVTASHDAMPTGRTNRVRLTQKGCVQFEPHWAAINVGQSLTWHSDLESSVTIHVSSGAFDKTQYVVRPGASVSTGPARSPGSYSIWTQPAACQDVPRGVQDSGPGVTVEGAAAR